MNNFPKTHRDWVYESLDVNAIKTRKVRLEALWALLVIAAVVFVTLFMIEVAHLNASSGWEAAGIRWDIFAIEVVGGFSAIAAGVLTTKIAALRHISREALAQLAQHIAEYPELKKQLLQQLLFQNNVIYEGQRKAFLRAISNAKTDRTLASLTANTAADAS